MVEGVPSLSGAQPAARRRAIRIALPPWLSASGRLARRALSEPLTHFLIAGFVIFAAGAIYQRQTSEYRIVVTPQHVAQIASNYALQFGKQPDPKTLEELVQRDVDDEILFRDGMAMKLDQDDEIVRHRVMEKTQFLIQDLNPPAEPTEAQLQAYYQAHASAYVSAPQATFTHIYFSADNGGDAAAQARALAVLHALPAGVARAPDKGDAFPDLYDFSSYEPEQVERLFGHTPFAQAVFTAPVGHWRGPFRSGYGWHLIYVASRQTPALPPLASVQGRVRGDYLQDASDATNKAAFAALARRFTVVRADLGQGS
jgi:parvulin-like peptidyl-prolyl isomerase